MPKDKAKVDYSGKQAAAQVLPANTPEGKKYFFGDYENKKILPQKSEGSPKTKTSNISFKEAFKKSNLTVAEYFTKLVRDYSEYSKNYNVPLEQYQAQLERFYIDCFELIEDSDSNALATLNALKKVAKEAGVQLTKSRLKQATVEKENNIKAEQTNTHEQISTPPSPANVTPVITPAASIQNKQTPSELLKRSVVKALDIQIKRLEEKINGCFSWCTIDAPTVQKKIDALNEMKKIVNEAKTQDPIYQVMYEITNNESFKPKKNTLVVRSYDEKILNTHRHGFFGNTTTHDELVKAFNPLKPKS
ncbi:MAG: hypothetical protein WC748_01535 [Legionellales bacterium]|jgi:hypothetical protein